MNENMFKLNISYNEYKNKEIEKHKEYKQLCQYVYHNGIPLPEGYEVLFVEDDKESGLYVEIVQKNNNIVIIARGTDKLFSMDGWKDTKNDITMSQNKKPSQYYKLKNLYDKVAEIRKNHPEIYITLTGHSLGGSIMQMLGAQKGDETVTFSALGAGTILSPKEIKYTSNITNYGSWQDPIFMLKLNYQIGEVRGIDTITGDIGHSLETWDDLNNYIPLNKQNNNFNPLKDINNYIDKNRYYNIIQNLNSPTGSSSDIKNYSSGKYKSTKSDCPGSYPVRGYT